MGVSTMGSLAAELPNESSSNIQTRVSKLDAEDPSFRNELRRRKEYYGMGSTYRLHRDGEGRKSITEKGTKSSEGRKRRGSGGGKGKGKGEGLSGGSIVVDKIQAVKEMRTEGGWEGEGKGGEVGGGLAGEDIEAEGNGGVKEVKEMKEVKEVVEEENVVDIRRLPSLAFTRPQGASPKHSVGKGAVGSPFSLPSPLLSETSKSFGGSGGRNLVTFSRPHRPSGLLLDPTFVPDEPVTEEGIDGLGNGVGKPRLLSKASLTSGGNPSPEVEAFSHTMNVMGSKVMVKGIRVAGPGSVMDGEGRPKSALTFENVHEATVRRELQKLRGEVDEGGD